MTPGIEDNSKPVYPICPHCKREPCAIGMRIIFFGGPPEAGGLPVAVFMCGGVDSPGCHKILSVAPLPVPGQQVERAPASEQPMIITPGMLRQ